MRILITGITGSVGTAFADLLTKYGHDVFGIDHNEERVAAFRGDVPVKVGEFDEYDFEGQDIDVLIHLAAMKHVDLCEQNPNSCVTNNLVRTHTLFKNAHRNEADILFMSTDKAVEPNSVYGYTKALAERMVVEYGGAYARSGNVVASNGSVLGIWDEAIKNGEPISITDKRMRRFFVSVDNLVERVWNLYTQGNQEIIPEMDRDVLLVELAEEKLAEHGYTLKNYPGGVKYTGIRPGEKLEEKLQ